MKFYVGARLRWVISSTPGSKNPWYQLRTEGGGVGGVQIPPTEIPKALQNSAKLKPIVKTVKNCWI